MTEIQASYGYKKHNKEGLHEFAEIAGHWLAEFFALKDVKKVTITIDRHLDCWGECGEPSEPDIGTPPIAVYEISVHPKQSLRDFIATIVHEFVHIKQWETGKWDGDGEAEAYHLQYSITDRMWKEGVF